MSDDDTEKEIVELCDLNILLISYLSRDYFIENRNSYSPTYCIYCECEICFCELRNEVDKQIKNEIT